MNASTGVATGDKPGRLRRWWIWAPVLLLCLLAGGWLGLKHSATG